MEQKNEEDKVKKDRAEGKVTENEETSDERSSSSEQEENRSSLKVLLIILGVIAVFIIGFFVASKYFITHDIGEGNSEMYTYNGFEFKNVNGFWFTDIQMSNRENMVFNVELRNDPRTVEDIYIHPELITEFYKSKGFFLTADPDLGADTAIAMIEVARIVGTKNNMLNYPTLVGVSRDYDTNLSEEDKAEIITCGDANSDYKVIWFGLGDSTYVDFESNCIKVYGSNESDIIRSADRLLYGIFRIM